MNSERKEVCASERVLVSGRVSASILGKVLNSVEVEV